MDIPPFGILTNLCFGFYLGFDDDDNSSASTDLNNTLFTEDANNLKLKQEYDGSKPHPPSIANKSPQFKATEKETPPSFVQRIFTSKKIFIGVLFILLGTSIVVNIYVALYVWCF